MATNPLDNLVNKYRDLKPNTASAPIPARQPLAQTSPSSASTGDFDVLEVLRYGKDTTFQNLTFLPVIFIILALINYIPGAIAGYFRAENAILATVLTLIGIFLNTLVKMGKIQILLEIVNDQPKNIANLFQTIKPFIKFYVAGVLYVAVITVGLILFIVPGIIIALRLQFYPFYIVGYQQGTIESMKSSFAITKGKTTKLLLFSLLSIPIQILGVLALVIGSFIAQPIVAIGRARIFKHLQEK